ncbi:MAG: malto-oligosyltrehalose synthase [Okeania sp. SIO2C9]|uniref:malto-oligosyltrehalose synthase n=1 Tax=Okeania sp. SIO2C9 TaxID=2607791 RepID=UPI0013C16C4E|nr:malto-oligosyltrehalose synthase [Okeania sp. SIO2C9]NEQ76127.1 malto-oligosyltrehalose synthase [Okeania sp. SIO2C9]
MRIPITTYRIQFTSNFGFDSAKVIVPYLAELGISDIYASPIFKAKTGSNHGYDVVNSNILNPELGGKEKFAELATEIKSNQMGWLQDIVPNHMAFSSQNHILVDVLENGPESQYRDYFDIDWNHPYEGIKGRVLAPFLGKFYGDCLESGELKLHYGQNGLTVNYYDHQFPIRIDSYTQVLTYNIGKLRNKLGRKNQDFVKLQGVLYSLKYIPSGAEGRERYDQISFIKGMLWELWNENLHIKEFIEDNIKTFNGVPGKPESFDLLDKLLSEQYFRLSFWKVGNEELNYRRFFTVNDLISVRVEDEQVFNTTHALILEMLKEEKFTGLRIDHIDGLYDPAQYLNRLREKANAPYIVVEKILEPSEDLPVNWPVQGTTGYDFLNYVNGIFCDHFNEEEFDQIYSRFIKGTSNYGQLADENQRLIINKHLAGDIDNLAHLLKDISSKYRYASDFTIFGLKAALVEVMSVFPVYRTYVSKEGVSKADRECIQRVIAKTKEKIPFFINELLNELSFIEKFLLFEFDEHLNQEDQDKWLHFVMRLQQFTGPLMAKGVEDTVLYVYNRLISLNEVGSTPSKFGVSVEDFHGFNQHRIAYWPHTMSGTSTHDTKRGEDVRTRINVLSEIPEEWESYLQKWQEINAPQKDCVAGLDVPAPNDEYFLYQTLLGAFPVDESEYPTFVERIKEYIIKAIREAKVNTGWLRPDDDYESSLIKFVEHLLNKSEDNEFLPAFRPLQRKVQYYGVFNSLSQAFLKLTSPGVPDIYQGTELWDLSLVDPDNRRPIDFENRAEFLKEIKTKIESDILGLIEELLQTPETGKIKMFLIYQALQARREYLDLFQRGNYQKLFVMGSLKDHIVAFSRKWGDSTAIIIAPRLLTKLIQEGENPLGEQVWRETRICLPSGSSLVWKNAITQQKLKEEKEDTLWIRNVLNHFPVALLINEQGETNNDSELTVDSRN